MNVVRAEKRGPSRSDGRKVSSRSRSHEALLAENVFEVMLITERRRAERSGKPFALALISCVSPDANTEIKLAKSSAVIRDGIRDSDLIGWYEQDFVLGVVFTELGEGSTADTLRSKILRVLRDKMPPKVVSSLVVTVHMFPVNWESEEISNRVADAKLYPEISRKKAKGRLPIIAKRGIDIIGSILLLVGFAPVVAVIAAAIKLTSRGPVLFRQERIGRLGRPFQCLKFRTMYSGSDAAVHREYVRSFISGNGDGHHDRSEASVYKIVNDPRVTPVGRILRKTSLDELPQFWNVLRGEMSLVGPRPPVRYEFEVYDLWHQRRVVEVKPGITGLWQVTGRSRTSFDDMVRLDLRYCREWSLSMDLKILLATPRVMFLGDGAF